jgi:hypothetical protein
MLSTIGSFGAWAGYPVGTVVEYACDERGRPVFAFSSLSSHTPDIKANPRCSLTITAPDFKVARFRWHPVSMLFFPRGWQFLQTVESHSVEPNVCQGMADARVTVTGQVSALSGGELESAKAVFKAKNPGMKRPRAAALPAFPMTHYAGSSWAGSS